MVEPRVRRRLASLKVQNRQLPDALLRGRRQLVGGHALGLARAPDQRAEVLNARQGEHGRRHLGGQPGVPARQRQRPPGRRRDGGADGPVPLDRGPERGEQVGEPLHAAPEVEVVRVEQRAGPAAGLHDAEDGLRGQERERLPHGLDGLPLLREGLVGDEHDPAARLRASPPPGAGPGAPARGERQQQLRDDLLGRLRPHHEPRPQRGQPAPQVRRGLEPELGAERARLGEAAQRGAPVVPRVERHEGHDRGRLASRDGGGGGGEGRVVVGAEVVAEPDQGARGGRGGRGGGGGAGGRCCYCTRFCSRSCCSGGRCGSHCAAARE